MLAGAAHAGLAADAIKETDPSIDTVSPPKIGDAVESVIITGLCILFTLLRSCNNYPSKVTLHHYCS